MNWEKTHQKAIAEQEIIRPLAVRFRNSKAEILEAARKLSCSRSAIYRKIAEYRKKPYLSTLEQKKNRSRSTRLPADTEKVIQEYLAADYLGKKEKWSVGDLHAKICVKCEELGIIQPSIRTIYRRTKKIPKRKLAQAGQLVGSRRAWDPHPGHHVINYPLQEVQIDHTLMDVMIDLREYGLGVRRPWLTLAIDTATRLVYGYYIGLKTPTSQTFMFALLQGASSKEKWLKSKGVSWDAVCASLNGNPWPVSGLPELVHMDNGADFRSGVVKRACRMIGIDTQFRPVGKPHYGGHIERLIGNFMGRLKMLPGATYSNVVEKAEYEAESRAKFSLDNLEQWFLLEVLRYHLHKHSSINCTPLQRYAETLSKIPFSALAQPDVWRVRYAFLPSQGRKVRPTGITLNHQTYWHPDLTTLIGQDVRIFYKPWDLKTISLSLDGVSEYLSLERQSNEHNINHMDVLELKRTNPVVVAETERQAKIERELRCAQIDLIAEVKRQSKEQLFIEGPQAKKQRAQTKEKLMRASEVPICKPGSRIC